MPNHRLYRKKFLILLIVLIGTLLLLPGCGGYPPFTSPISLAYLSGIMIQPDTMDLEEGESQSIISVTAYYSDSSTENIPLINCSYYSYNPSCASVNSSGLITGVSAGSTTILVTYSEGTVSKIDTIVITVTTVITPITLISIEVLPSSMNLNVGESQTISSVTAFHDNSSSTNINLTDCNYISSNPDCATVSNSGTVTAVSGGSAIITISYTEGGVTKTTSAEITVGTVTQNEVVYRALLVGIGDYINYGSDGDLLAPPYDVDRIKQILNYCKFGSSNTGLLHYQLSKELAGNKIKYLAGYCLNFLGRRQ